jgi:cardiolipin synthase
MNLPNFISLARLLAVPVVIYLILHGFDAAAFWLCVAAGLSDAIDGYLAKRLGQASELGALLDPIADKTLLVGVYLALGHMGHIASWLVILVVSRDLLIVGGVLLLKLINDRPLLMQPFMISKVNTTVQIVLATLVLAQLGHEFDAGIVVVALTYLVAATTLASGAAYLVAWGRHAASLEQER